MADKPEKPAAPVLESIKDHPAVQGFPEWILEMHPHDIMSLGYDDLNYSEEIFEQALVTLHVRKWGFDKIHFYHHVILTPIMWTFFFNKPVTLTMKTVMIRWVLLFLMAALFLSGVYALTSWLDTIFLFFLVMGVGGLCFLIINTMIGVDNFDKWRKAMQSLGAEKLNALLPQKKKKAKKKK